MNVFRITAAVALFGFAGIAPAQVPGSEDTRGSVPPGTAIDGSRPSDGAITGGSILPGESGGLPGGRSGDSSERLKRCNELSGTLRDDCLLKEQSSTTGAAKAPGAKTAPPRDAPPPQNPR
jgi:hypothetical protein